MEGPKVDTPVLSDQQRALIRTLLYFDLFDHPLRRDELLHFSTTPIDDLDASLAAACAQGWIQERSGYFAVAPIAPLIQRRIEKEARATRRMATARRMSRMIGRFPFVRGVLLSGSISKGVMDRHDDIDYFIITAPGRLWVARTLLILYRMIFRLNSRRDFCVNYFVSSDHLVIEDRNLFTATELVTLIPTHGPVQCAAFFEANAWAFDHFPNRSPEPSTAPAPRNGHHQGLLERLFLRRIGDRLDDLFMRSTLKRWKRKFGHLDEPTFELAFRTRKHVSKQHARLNQRRVLEAFERNVRAFELRHGIDLS